MEKKVDKYGFTYYPELSDEFRLATLNDFHEKRILKLGMEYVIKHSDSVYYECRTVNENLTARWLKPFIDENRVFVKK